MSDDIVTRLRELAEYVRVDCVPHGFEDCMEAAAEIERLRNENWELAKYIFDFLQTVRNG